MTGETSSPDQGPRHKQIESELRQAILSGAMASGTKLPSAMELVARFSASAATIQSALAPLVSDGLIERTRKRGSFVRGRSSQLTNAAVYFCSDFWESPDAALYRELYRDLTREFSAEGVRHNLWIDHRAAEDQAEPLPGFLNSVRSGNFQALIVGRSNALDMTWLSQAGLPMAVYGSSPLVSARVNMDWRQVMNQAVGELKRQGCRSVGLISAMPVWGTAETDHAEDVVAFTKQFVEVSTDLGLAISREWVRTPPTYLPSTESEAFGYRQFQELWRQEARPDGLIVFPDIMVRGAITSILQQGVSVPRDIKLVLHRNEGIPILCPFPASWLVTSIRQITVALIEQIRRQLDGKQVQPTYLSLGLETSEGFQ